MDTVQFRDFVFPHNPSLIQVSAPQAVAGHFCPGRGEVVQGLGPKNRQIRCEGSFCGDTYAQAAAVLREFREKTADGSAGTLFLPGMEPFLARLKEIAFSAQGDGRIIPYTILFVEAGEVGRGWS